jgi:hypothetical protein
MRHFVFGLEAPDVSIKRGRFIFKGKAVQEKCQIGDTILRYTVGKTSSFTSITEAHVQTSITQEYNALTVVPTAAGSLSEQVCYLILS